MKWTSGGALADSAIMSQLEQIQEAAAAAFDAVRAEIKQKLSELGEQKGMWEAFQAFTAAVDWHVCLSPASYPPSFHT